RGRDVLLVQGRPRVHEHVVDLARVVDGDRVLVGRTGHLAGDRVLDGLGDRADLRLGHLATEVLDVERQLLVRDRHSRVGRGVERDVDRGLGQLVHRDDARTGDVGTADGRVVLAGAAQRAGTGRGARGHADGDRVTGGALEAAARVAPHQ